MLDAYLRETAACATENQFNRVHIDLENRLLPSEAAQLVAEAGEAGAVYNELARFWFGRMAAFLGRSALPIQRYARQPLGRSIAVYAVPAPPEVRRTRTLVVAFPGGLNRLMLPLAVFLQHCDGERFEFMILKDDTRSHFARGIEGFAPDMAGLVARLGPLAASGRYRRIVSFGTSSGGFPAFWTAIAHGHDRGVSIGGPSPDQMSEIEDVDPAPYRREIEARAGALPELVYAYGERNPRDAAKARSNADYAPMRTIAVPGVDDHNLLFELLKRGELQAFLERVLDAPRPPA